MDQRSDDAASFSHFVEGQLAPSQSERRVSVLNPSNGKHLYSIPEGCERDVDHAVASAARAFETGLWNAAPPSYKKATLNAWADLIASHAAELDRLDAEDMGKPVSTRFGDAASAADLVRFCSEAVDKITGDVYISDKRSLVIQRRVPRGVVAAVVPWNFPASNAVLKIAPALAAGNSVVLKPSELSSRSAVLLARLALDAGIPPGVLNVVLGLGEIVGRALGLHKQVDMMAFTGSTTTGRRMLQYSGESNMKVVLAECGGKSPQIVFADGVDVEAASRWVADLLLTNQGQICSVGSRLLVHKSIELEMVERIAKRAEHVTMGDALDPRTTFGPLASKTHCERVINYIRHAPSSVELVTGGQQVKMETGGNFVQPTVFRSVDPKSQIAQEEIFGPVLTVTAFSDEEEAIRIANGTRYGLAAYIWTANLSTAMRMVGAVKASIWVNSSAPAGEGAGYASSAEPFGQSGVGVEGGIAGMESYLHRQLVRFNHA